MLICTCPNDLECPAIGSDVVCFPWCEYLEDGDTFAATEKGRTSLVYALCQAVRLLLMDKIKEGRK